MIRQRPFELGNDPREYPLYDPLLRPFAGVASRPDPSALPEGGWAGCGGFRRDREILRSRDGSVRLTSSPIVSGGTFKGAWEGRLNGTNYIVAAVASSSKIRLLYSSDYGVTWTEFSDPGTNGSDDKYGETRMTETDQVYFEKFTDRQLSRDLLIIQNGTDFARIWDPLASDGAAPNSCKTAIHKQVPLPSALGQFRVSWRFYDEVEVNNTGITSYSASSANVTGANVNTYPNMLGRITISTSAVSGNNVNLIFSTSLYFENPAHAGTGIRAKQLCLLIDCSDRAILNKLKFTIWDGASSKIIHNGATGSQYPFVEESFDRVSNKRFIAWDITEVGWTNIDSVQIEWVDSSSPSSAITLDVLGIVSTGCISPGSKDASAEFGVAFRNSGSRAISAGIVLRNDFTVRLQDEGFTSLDQAVIPQRQGLFYYPSITFVMPSLTDIGTGIDYLDVFFRDADGFRSFLISSIKIGEYTGGAWADAGSFTAGTKEVTSEFNPIITNLTTWQNEKVELPATLHRPIPKGKAMLNANGRLFVAGTQDNSSACSVCWVSQRNNPTRFLYIPDSTDDDSATYNTFDGEDICRMVASAAERVGNSSVFVVTDEWTYLLNGFGASLSHPIRIAKVGSRSPRSFGFNKNEWYFVDETLRVRRVGNFDDLSRHTWDDKFQAIPASRRQHVAGCVHLDRYYCGYSIAAGSTNTRALVWNSERSEWEADDPLPTGGGLTAEQLLVVWDGSENRKKLLAFGSDCHVYEFEKPGVTTDVGNGSGVAVELSSRKIHFGMTTYLSARRVRVVGSSASSSLSVVRTYDPGSGTGTSSLSFAPKASETEVSRFDGVITGSGDQLGYNVQVTLSGNLLGGKNVKGIYVEISEVDRIGDSV